MLPADRTTAESRFRPDVSNRGASSNPGALRQSSMVIPKPLLVQTDWEVGNKEILENSVSPSTAILSN